jgi:hypothetical protein
VNAVQRDRETIAVVGPIGDQVRTGAEAITGRTRPARRSSAGRKRSIEFTADDHFSPAMLPLVSTTMPRLTGVRSALKLRHLDGLVVLVDDEILLAQAAVKASDRSVTVAVTLNQARRRS